MKQIVREGRVFKRYKEKDSCEECDFFQDKLSHLCNDNLPCYDKDYYYIFKEIKMRQKHVHTENYRQHSLSIEVSTKYGAKKLATILNGYMLNSCFNDDVLPKLKNFSEQPIEVVTQISKCFDVEAVIQEIESINKKEQPKNSELVIEVSDKDSSMKCHAASDAAVEFLLANAQQFMTNRLGTYLDSYTGDPVEVLSIISKCYDKHDVADYLMSKFMEMK